MPQNRQSKQKKKFDLEKATQLKQELLNQIVNFANSEGFPGLLNTNERRSVSAVYKNQLGELYVRRTWRLIGDDLKSSTEIANISFKPQYRGYGIGTKLIEEIHLGQMRALTYVESVHNVGLDAYLSRSGWIRDQKFNFYKLKN